MCDELKRIKSIKELADLLLVKYHEVASNFSNICSVVYIFLRCLSLLLVLYVCSVS